MSPETIREKEEQIHQVVRAILVSADGLICIGKRAQGNYEGGKWCLVGGKAEGMVLNEELFREIGEETGIPVCILSDETQPMFVFHEDGEKDGKIYRNNYYMLEIDDLQIPQVMTNFNRREFSEIAFITAEDIKGLRFAFGNGKAVRDYFRYVGN